MKARLNKNEDVGQITEKYREKIAFDVRKGCSTPVAIYLAGTIFEGEDAVTMVQNGQATPIDEECMVACGLTKEQIESKSIGYEMDCKGIHSEKDRDLYRAGVILGYDDELEYIPGPNWQSYQDALKELEKADEV